MNDRKVRERANRCVNLCLEGIALRRILGLTPRPGPPNYKTNIRGTAGEAVSRVHLAAGRERCRTGAANDPKPDVDELESWENLAKKYLDMSELAENPARSEYSDRGLCGEIAHLAIEAYGRGLISRGRLLELGAILEIRGKSLLDIGKEACGD